MSYAQQLHQGIDPLRSMANKGGGGGGGGTSVTTQEIPAELKPLANQYTTSAISLSNQPYNPYYGQRFADLNGTQYQGIGMTANRALGGDATVNAGANYLQSTLYGQNQPTASSNAYMGASTGQANNPYIGASAAQANNPYIGSTASQAFNQYIGAQTVGIGNNPYQGATTSVGVNAYSGANPYLNNAIKRSMDDVQTRVNSQFGGSNYGTSANQEVLARELGNVNSSMRMQDYGLQQGIAENALNRSVQAQQADLARNAGLAQDTNQFNAQLRASDLARNAQLAGQNSQFNSQLNQADIARNAQLYGQNAQFNSQLQQADLARNAGLYDNYANRQLQAWQLGNAAQANAASLGLGYGNQAYTDASQLLNAGNQMQDQLQQQYDFNYQQFLDQQNLPYKNLAAMSGVFGSNLGGTSTTTSNQSSGGK